VTARRAGLGLLLLALPPPAQAGSALDEAYRRERELLEAEKKALLDRVVATESDSRLELERLREEVAERSERLTALRLENEAAEERLAREEETAEVGADAEVVLESTLEQALSTLSRHGVEVEGTDAEPEELVPRLFEAGCTLAERIGRLRVEEGTWFGADGAERRGPLLRVGGVAAVALDPVAGGTLAPAGADALKVIVAQSLPAARALVAGEKPPLVGLYLFDPLERGARPAREERTLVETFLAGGFVMWPILALALLAVLILLERLFVLHRVHTNADRLMRRVGERISRGHWTRAAEVCRLQPGAVSRVLVTVLDHRRLPRSQLEDLVNEAILAEEPTLERFLPALNVVAAVSPLLGLLGTVTGMIATFLVITEHGTGDPRLLSGGISEALLTTQFGLMVAIPALLTHAFLASRVDHVLSDMETNALRLLNTMHCEHCERLKEEGCLGGSNGERVCPQLAGQADPTADESVGPDVGEVAMATGGGRHA